LEIEKEVIMPNRDINSKSNNKKELDNKDLIIEFFEIINPNGINNKKISSDEIETEVNFKGRNTRYPTQVRNYILFISQIMVQDRVLIL
jgi:hypothetical protein